MYSSTRTKMDHLACLDAAEGRNRALPEGKAWPEGQTAPEFIAKARTERKHGDYEL